MKITGVAVRRHGEGYELTLTAFLAEREELDESDLAKMIDALREMGEGKPSREISEEEAAEIDARRQKQYKEDKAAVKRLRSVQPGIEEPTPPRAASEDFPVRPRRRRGEDPVGDRFADALDTPAAQAEIKAANEALKAIEAEAAAVVEGSRRRRRSASDQAMDQPHHGHEAEEPEAAPATRRRRGAVPTTDASTAAPDASSSKPTPTDASPVSRRRRSESPLAVVEDLAFGGRRRRRAEDPTPAAASAPTAEAGGRTRRRTASVAAPATSGDDEITDADLSKACSAAARVILPKGVMEILGEFGVENSQSIAQKDRREFLDALKEASEA